MTTCFGNDDACLIGDEATPPAVLKVTSLDNEMAAWRSFFRDMSDLHLALRERNASKIKDAIEELRCTAYATNFDLIHIHATRILLRYEDAAGETAA